MSRIVTSREARNAGTGISRVIGDTHRDNATPEIIDFCGQNVVDAIDRKLSGSNGDSTRVYFEKEGKYYHIYKGLNGTQSPGRFTYNVYQYVGNGGDKPDDEKKIHI